MKKLLWYIDHDERIGKIIETELPKINDTVETHVINNPIVIDGKLNERLPDIIFVDFAIASQDNASIIKDLRNNRDVAKIPFVLMGSDVRIEDRAKELETEFLKKPFDMEQFQEKIKEVLKKS
jgi:DNA-binding NtrC family response regulator